VNASFVAVLLFIISRSDRWSLRAAIFARMVFVVVVVPTVFTQLGSLVPYVNPAPWEERLFALDLRICAGVNPLEALERVVHPILTESLQWVYDFYYFIAIFPPIIVVASGRLLAASRMMFAFSVCLYLSYIGYFLVPASGPNLNRLGLYDFEAPLNGVFLAGELRQVLAVVEKIKLDCFPSGHTAVSLLALMLAFRYARQLVGVMAPLVIALIFSTVYLRYHYLTDVIGGVILAIVAFSVSERIHAAFERRAGMTEDNCI
jgi:membrane-associated phospholipid phosphatase